MRAEYRALTANYSEAKFQEQNETVFLEILKVIKRDILRTQPESPVFRHPVVQRSLVRALMIYSVRHPSNLYSQGMNDILAPIFAVFLAEALDVPCFEMIKSEKITEKLNALDCQPEAEHKENGSATAKTNYTLKQPSISEVAKLSPDHAAPSSNDQQIKLN